MCHVKLGWPNETNGQLTPMLCPLSLMCRTQSSFRSTKFVLPKAGTCESGEFWVLLGGCWVSNCEFEYGGKGKWCGEFCEYENGNCEFWGYGNWYWELVGGELKFWGFVKYGFGYGYGNGIWGFGFWEFGGVGLFGFIFW